MAAVGFLSPARWLFCHNHGHRSHHNRDDSLSSTSPARQLLFLSRCSSEAAPEVVSTEDGAPSPTSEIPVGTQKKTSSLISTINVQKAIRGIEITNVDHYGRLGLARGDSYDKVNSAYQKMCEEVMNQGLDEEEANKRLDLLKESYGILSSEEERRLYDWSLARNEMPDRYVWPFEVDITQTPTQPPPPPQVSLLFRSQKMLHQLDWWVTSSLDGLYFLLYYLWPSTDRKQYPLKKPKFSNL